MADLDYRKKEKQWSAYHKLEQKNKNSFFKKLSVSDGFKILDGLYSFGYNLGRGSSSKKIDMGKIRVLAVTHFIFGRVKT